MAGLDKSKKRCITGIPGFDKLCEGGLVQGSVNVLLGGPGAGKTTFLLQFLYNGASKFKENGLFISFEPDLTSLEEDAAQLGMDFTKLVDSKKCHFLRLLPRTEVRDMKEQLATMIKKHDIKRICMDPISVFSISSDKPSDFREAIFDLTVMLKKLNVTIILSDETIEGATGELSLGNGDFKSEPLKFLADAVINLYSSGLGGVSDRAVRISKMRRTAHVRGPVGFQITNSGIKVSGK